MRLDYLTDLKFPQYPSDLLQDKDILRSYTKANAYVTIALEESNINHNRSCLSAIITDMTHDLEENNYSSREYLMDAQLEIDNIIENINEYDNFKRDLNFVNKTINMALQN